MIDGLSTPYFLINKDALEDGLMKLKKTLQSEWPDFIIGYSYKTNALPWVINYFKNQSCYAEVVSDDEYELAKSIGVDDSNIIYNGIAKEKESFLSVVQNNGVVNIDSEYEIDWLEELPVISPDRSYNVGIRVNFDLERYCPGQTQCGQEGERFGFCYENGDLRKAIEKIKEKGVKVTGLHLHKSSKTRMPDIYKAIAEVTVEISREYNLELKYIDIGGGFFGGLETKPQFSEYFEMICGILRKQFDPKLTKLIVEPGMALIGAPVDYVTTVKDVKETTRNRFVITDGSRIHIDPLMTKSNYFYEIIGNDRSEIVAKQVISGFTCMEHDRLFELKGAEKMMPEDLIIYHKVGAYTMSLSPLFIKWFPEVYVRDGEQVYQVRDRWKTEDYRGRSV